MERYNGTVLKIIRIAGIEKKNWKSEMYNFLFHYRTTPHSVMGISPGELLMGRKLRDNLPKVTIASDQLHKTNKLTPNFEPVPSQVIRKSGNAVIV